MELYILSKQDLSILSICKLADYQINLDEETNAKSTFTLMKTNGLKKENYMVLNGLYRQFIFVIDDVQTEKGSDVVTVTALDISNIFDRKVIEKNIDIMKSKSIEEFLANTISEDFVNSDDTALNVNYIEIYWHTNTQGNVATNAENGLYNFHTFLTNCRQYKNIYTDFKLENLGKPQTVEGKRISVEAKNRKIVDISLHGESTQNGTPTPANRVEIENVEGKNKFSGFVKGIAINPTHGHQYAGETVASSDYIAVDFNQNPNYYLSGLTNTLQTFVAAYNSNKEFLGRTGAKLVSFFSLNSSSFTGGTAQGTGDIACLRVTTYENTALGTTGAIDDIDNLKTQLEEGTVATPYVPYNSLEFKVEGKNKFDKSKNFTSSNISKDLWTITQIENGLRVMSNSSDGTPYIRYIITDLSNFIGKTIRAKANFVSSSANKGRYRLSICNADGTNPTMKNLTDESNKEISFVVETLEEEKKFLSFDLYSNGTGTQSSSAYVDYTDIIITIDNEDMTYEPYKSQVATFPLSEGQKLMEGSYLADDGIHHTRKQVVFDGSDDENWQIESTNNFYSNIVIQNSKSSSLVLCNYQKSINKGLGESENCFISTSKKFNFQSDTINHTVADFKNWLSTHNLIVEYELAEPETVSYTAEQQETWNKIKNLTLFEGVNHISSDANMVLKYYPLEPVGLKFVLRIDIENKQETTKLIDTTLPEVTDYNKIYEADVTAKVQVYIREDGSEYNLYLKTDRTTTTNKDDPDRASGKIEVISVETADRAEEEALNVMKGNNYKHLVEFKIAKTSKLMDITKLHIRKTYKNQNRRRYI